MKIHKAIVVATVVVLALWASVPSANAFCMDDGDCGPHLCVNNRCTACIAPGFLDDVLYVTNCCSGQAVPGSTYCANPADWGTTWASCTQICQ